MTQVLLNGQVANDGGFPGNGWFEYGYDETYGNVTAPQGPLATGDLYSALLDLPPNQLFHFRAVFQNVLGIAYGTDFSFVTMVAPGFPGEPVGSIPRDILLFDDLDLTLPLRVIL